MISAETIELVKAKADLVDVTGSFLTLKKKGSEYVALCPFHNEKTPSFTVSPAKGIYKCFGCGKSGDAIAFVMDHENKTYPQAIEWLANRYDISVEDGGKPKEFDKPIPRLEKISKKAIAWFEERGISNDTTLRAGITEAMEWMPKFEKEVPAICFNYLRGEELVNIKFRGPQKAFKLAKNAELIFYNLNGIEGQETAVITEGEMDTLSCIESGIYNVVSVPNGAGTGSVQLEYLDRCWTAFEDKKMIILATDNDHPGRTLREELCRRLGVDRCYQVDYTEGCKDLNDVLMKHGREEVKRVIESARPWPIKGVLTIEELAPTVFDWYYHGYPAGAKTKIPGLDQFITFAPGHITTITGIPQHGKDEFTNWIMAALAQHEDWPWGVLGFEETAHETATKLAEKFTKRAFDFRKDLMNRMSPEQLTWALAQVDEYFNIINPDDIDPNIDSILGIATQLVKQKGIKGLYLNPWNWIDQKRPAGMTETDYVSMLYSQLIRWARKYGVHIFLVAHTTKMQKGPDGKYIIPTLYSISGSANFFNKTSNGITVYRNYEDNTTTIYIQKIKQSWLGQLGWVSFRYNVLTRQYEFIESSIRPSTTIPVPVPELPGNWSRIPTDSSESREEDDQPF